MASALFTLARKIAPCIIFIDEIDSLLRSRGTHDHEATAMIKAQFMQMWDGLETTSESVIVMGATNRPKGTFYFAEKMRVLLIQINIKYYLQEKVTNFYNHIFSRC